MGSSSRLWELYKDCLKVQLKNPGVWFLLVAGLLGNLGMFWKVIFSIFLVFIAAPLYVYREEPDEDDVDAESAEKGKVDE